MKMRRKNSIVYLRSFAALLIFFCHILLISGYVQSSMWLNSGVQIFFIISAYLLTTKELNTLNDVKKFLLKRCKKIFVSYWIYITIISLLLIFVHRQPSLQDYLIYFIGGRGFFSDARILGLGHLWFVSVIIVCYLLTPILYQISKIDSSKKKHVCVSILYLVIVISMLILRHPSYSVYIISYAFSYFYFRKRNGEMKKTDLIFWIILALGFSILRLIVDNSGIETWKYYEMYDAICVPVFRTFLGMGITAGFLYNEKIFVKKPICKLVGRFADLSYEFYITHQFIQLALWEFVPWFRTNVGIWCWIVICLGLSLCNAYILHWITRCVEELKLGMRKESI